MAVSAYASQAGLERRPVIGGFSRCDCERVIEQKPDLVLAFSDVQADFAAQLIRAGCTVLATNQRDLAGIAASMRLIGGALGKTTEAAALAEAFTRELESLRFSGPDRPRVYFEEWPEPLISGIGWVGEMIELCGGIDVFAARRGQASRDRVVLEEQVIAAAPQIILASWCGRPVNLDAIRARAGFADISAIRANQLHALDSAQLLQPGWRVLEGARTLRGIFDGWRARMNGCAPADEPPLSRPAKTAA